MAKSTPQREWKKNHTQSDQKTRCKNPHLKNNEWKATQLGQKESGKKTPAQGKQMKNHTIAQKQAASIAKSEKPNYIRGKKQPGNNEW